MKCPSSINAIWALYTHFKAPKFSQKIIGPTSPCFHTFPPPILSPLHRMEKTRKQLNISNLVMEESSWTWFSVTRGTVIWLNHFSGHFVRRISSIIPLIAMSNAIASWVLSQTKVSASGQKVTFCLHDYFLKHLSSPRCESWLFCL